MTKLNNKIEKMLITIKTIERLAVDEKKMQTRVGKKKIKLQIEAYLLDLDEKIRSLKLQDFRDFKAELKTISATENDHDSNNEHNT